MCVWVSDPLELELQVVVDAPPPPGKVGAKVYKEQLYLLSHLSGPIVSIFK